MPSNPVSPFDNKRVKIMDNSKCKGIMGYIFGHKFRTDYNYECSSSRLDENILNKINNSNRNALLKFQKEIDNLDYLPNIPTPLDYDNAASIASKYRDNKSLVSIVYCTRCGLIIKDINEKIII